MLVHDLKAPLAIIMAGMELLSLELDPQLDTDQRGIFASAGRASQEMLKLITNLLEVQRLQSGRMPVCPEPLDLPQVLQEAVSQARFLARQRGVDAPFTPSARIGLRLGRCPPGGTCRDQSIGQCPALHAPWEVRSV